VDVPGPEDIKHVDEGLQLVFTSCITDECKGYVLILEAIFRALVALNLGRELSDAEAFSPEGERVICCTCPRVGPGMARDALMNHVGFLVTLACQLGN
jgi:hypothetical protein